MLSCTFFGHRDCPDSIYPKLRNILVDFIVNRSVSMFYVGNQGHFDALVRRVLRQLTQEYPQVNYAVVLAYMPASQNEYDDASDTMLPEGIELVHPRFAISWRNNWMVSQSNFVVCYIIHHWGGAAKFVDRAKDAGCTVINIAE